MIPFGWHVWRGESRKRYRFNITLTNKGVPDGGGIYVFVRRRFHFWLEPLYIGKATSFRSRVLGHERWEDAWWKYGATERHFMHIKSARNRARIEEDLIRRYKPKMNNILVPRHINDAPNNPKLRRKWEFRRMVGRWLGWAPEKA